MPCSKLVSLNNHVNKIPLKCLRKSSIELNGRSNIINCNIFTAWKNQFLKTQERQCKTQNSIHYRQCPLTLRLPLLLFSEKKLYKLGYGDFKILNNAFQSKFGTLAPQKMQKTFDSMSQKSSASVLQKWRKIEFLLNFHVCCFNNNRYEWIKIFMWCIYIFSFKSKKWSWIWSRALLDFFVFLYFEL